MRPVPKLIVSGAVLESRWPSWAVRSNEPSGFRGCKFIEPCFGISHSLSLICQLTSEDIKHHFRFIIITNAEYSFTSTETRRLGRTDSPGQPPRFSLTQLLNYEREYQKQSGQLYIGGTGLWRRQQHRLLTGTVVVSRITCRVAAALHVALGWPGRQFKSVLTQ